eukprot:CAMPEP_0197059570 /NCGR_PEP_ID=MMETSP1384-20130603/118804_1 /TAXON_ID=29189 /ORGANISM="Ammonia sp." /LENGTH=65 /DNA_ID=CAMNT_0042494661 /DNA_START=30 /DNA_END=223 /DNA_ORIENTATION=+
MSDCTRRQEVASDGSDDGVERHQIPDVEHTAVIEHDADNEPVGSGEEPRGLDDEHADSQLPFGIR